MWRGKLAATKHNRAWPNTARDMDENAFVRKK
jgi:hypothetical protein